MGKNAALQSCASLTAPGYALRWGVTVNWVDFLLKFQFFSCMLDFVPNITQTTQCFAFLCRFHSSFLNTHSKKRYIFFYKHKRFRIFFEEFLWCEKSLFSPHRKIGLFGFPSDRPVRDEMQPSAGEVRLPRSNPTQGSRERQGAPHAGYSFIASFSVCFIFQNHSFISQIRESLRHKIVFFSIIIIYFLNFQEWLWSVSWTGSWNRLRLRKTLWPFWARTANTRCCVWPSCKATIGIWIGRCSSLAGRIERFEFCAFHFCF